MAAKLDYTKNQIAQQIVQQWGELTDEQYNLLLRNITIRRYKKNDYIYRDFESPNLALYLIHGKVKIFKDGIGRNQIVRVIRNGQFFGYRAFFAQEKYKTAATAFETCYIASFPIEILVQLMSQNFIINKYFIYMLSRELGISDDRTVNLTQKHIRGRLAEALLFLKDSYGIEEDGYTLSIYLSREDMASLSNMTTSNAIRTLSAFANEKIIAIDGRKIKIINDEELRRISNIG